MTMLHRLRRWVVPKVKPPWRRVRFRLAEVTDRGGRPEISGVGLPPIALQRLNGPGDFAEMGAAVVADVRRTVGLGAGDRVLDVGCGCGRVALHVIDAIGPTGTYDGFDIVPEAVSWCRRHITPVHPNFRFERVDVRSDHYHRGGEQSAARFRFPHADESFDVVILTSVFTHLRGAATENYLREAVRVLRPGGRIFATFFLLDDDARTAMAAGRAEQTFEAIDDGSYIADPHDPDAAVAHDAATITSILDDAGVEPAIRPGHWSGREAELGYQDVVTATKPGADDVTR